jgi:hypothetical protein
MHLRRFLEAAAAPSTELEWPATNICFGHLSIHPLICLAKEVQKHENCRLSCLAVNFYHVNEHKQKKLNKVEQ